jgi:hypothetical protein
MDKKVEQFFKTRGYRVKKSDSAKEIEKFNSYDAADALFSYLRLHPSCRVLFNTIKREPNDFFIEPLRNIDDFQEILKQSNTSFIYCANCSCGAPLDKPNITNDNFTLPENKQITCHKCGKINKITQNSYKPVIEIKPNDFLKFFDFAYNNGVFEFNKTLECIYCNEYELIVDDPKNNVLNVNLKCPNCHNVRYVTPKYILDNDFDEFLYDVQNNRKGYWLEWYVWRQLNEFNFTLGKILVTGEGEEGIAFEVDGIFVDNQECIILECKDTPSIKDTLPNLTEINEFADKWVLIATKEIKPTELKRAKKILKEKMIYIPPKNVDNVKSIIGDLLKRKPKQATLPDGF